MVIEMQDLEKIKSNSEEEKQKQNQKEYTGPISANVETSAMQTDMDRFNAAQGHGYAAEQANNLYDILTGKDAKIVGNDNAKDGADRNVDGVNIQTKYCQTAKGSVDAAFRDGKYRYINADGTPMQLEVPSDQYEQAVEIMRQKILNGEVPGVTDPNEAENIVRKGHFTYKQAVNIAKFGTIESITYDAVNGTIIAANAFGISATLTFALSMWNGDSFEVAVENSVYSGLQTGGCAFLNTVITSQLLRTGIPQLLNGPTEAISKMLGPKVCAAIANALRNGSAIYGAAAMKWVAKMLRGSIVTTITMTIIMSASDIKHAFEGKISGKQLFKNLTITISSVAAGAGIAYTVAGVIGSATVVGGVIILAATTVASMAAGKAAETITSQFIEDDAVMLAEIIKEEFAAMAYEYVLSEEEVYIILDDIERDMSGEALLEMFASPDRHQFARDYIRGRIERLISGRARILIPTWEEYLEGLKNLINDCYSGTGIFAREEDTSEQWSGYAEELLGHEISDSAVRKGKYAVKQMNIVNGQGEIVLKREKTKEENFKKQMSTLAEQSKNIDERLDSLLEGGIYE